MASYLPTSEFLNSVLEDEITFGDSQFGRANLARLLSFVTDADAANRDWATFLISGLSEDSPEIRNALLTASKDEDDDVCDEAIVGLARRDRDVALALLRPRLGVGAGIVLLEAAAILGEPSLVAHLKELESSEGGSEKFRDRLESAIAACETGSGRDVSKAEMQSQHRLSE